MNRMPLVSSALVLAVSLSAACSSSRKPDEARTQMAFGVKAARLNLWREARFRFDRATQNNPNDAMAHNNLAVALEGAGEFDHARLEYLRALQLDQSNQYIQKNYSRFMEFYGKKKELPKTPADGKAPETKAPTAADKPSGPTLPPVEVPTPPPGTGEPPSAAPGPGAAGPPSTSPPVPVAPNPAPPTPPPPTPPPNGGTTGGQR